MSNIFTVTSHFTFDNIFTLIKFVFVNKIYWCFDKLSTDEGIAAVWIRFCIISFPLFAVWIMKAESSTSEISKMTPLIDMKATREFDLSPRNSHGVIISTRHFFACRKNLRFTSFYQCLRVSVNAETFMLCSMKHKKLSSNSILLLIYNFTFASPHLSRNDVEISKWAHHNWHQS